MKTNNKDKIIVGMREAIAYAQMTPKALKLKAALEKETGKMVTFRSREKYNENQRKLQKKYRKKAKA